MKKKLDLNNFIPVNRPRITPRNAKDVFNAVKSGWVSSEGPEVKKFEFGVSKLINRKFATSVANGSLALEIAVKCLNLPKGSEVIIPNLTIISSILPLIRNDLIPILVDCGTKDWNMSFEQIKKKINKKTKCIIATHIYGYPCEIEKIIHLAKKKKIFVIEDAAEMFGHYNLKKKYYGSFGDISTFSFYSNKHITTGEGGMITTNSKKLHEKCNSLRNLGFGKGLDRFKHVDIGWNARMSNIQAALGNSQLKDIKKIIQLKKEVGTMYYNFLKKVKKIYIQSPKLGKKINIYWVVGVLNNSTKSTKNIVNKLKNKGIQTRPFFTPLSKQPILKKLINNKNNYDFPNSEEIYKKGFYLPSSIDLSKNEIKYICENLKKII